MGLMKCPTIEATIWTFTLFNKKFFVTFHSHSDLNVVCVLHHAQSVHKVYVIVDHSSKLSIICTLANTARVTT